MQSLHPELCGTVHTPRCCTLEACLAQQPNPTLSTSLVVHQHTPNPLLFSPLLPPCCSSAPRSPSLQPLHPELLLSESRARQVVQQYALHYALSGQVCRQLGVHPRLLGRLTGNIWVNDSSGERVDVGLAVKNAKQGLCVPGGSGVLGAGGGLRAGGGRCSACCRDVTPALGVCMRHHNKSDHGRVRCVDLPGRHWFGPFTCCMPLSAVSTSTATKLTQHPMPGDKQEHLS